jgi:hypothetical protein
MIFFSFIAILFLVFIILMRVYQNDIVGYIGEKYTARNIRRVVDGNVFTNIYVNGNFGAQQIDIIAVTPKGILVIEKKTYVGLIVGRERDKQWRVYTRYGQNYYLTKNPHHQNFGHIRALQENFPAMKNKCLDVVIFGNNAKLGDGIPAGTFRDADFPNAYRCLPDILTPQQITEYSMAIQGLENYRPANKMLHKMKIAEMKNR